MTTTNIVIGSGLQVGGVVTFSNNLSVTGTTTLTGDVTMQNNLSVTGTTTLTGDVTMENNLTVVGNINLSSISTTGSVNIDISQTTITGPTTGSLICSMPYQGSSYKKVIIYCNGYENDTTTAQTYSFPTSFIQNPYVNINQSGIPGTVTTQSITFGTGSSTVYTGFLVLEGY